MPNPDHFPPDIMDKAQAFTDALNAYLLMAPIWEKRFNPSQPRVPAGQAGGGQWTDGDGVGSVGGSEEIISGGTFMPSSGRSPRPTAMEMDQPRPIGIVHRPGDRPTAAMPHPDLVEIANPVLPQETIWHALEKVPTVIDPRIGMRRGRPISPPDTTRRDIGYLEGRSQNEIFSMIGSPPPGHQRHHIVPNSSMGQFTDRANIPETIQNSSNIVLLPYETHWCINGVYSAKVDRKGTLFREQLAKSGFYVQYWTGLKVIRECQERQKEKERARQQGESYDPAASSRRSPADLLPPPEGQFPTPPKPQQSPGIPPVPAPPRLPSGRSPSGFGNGQYRPGGRGSNPKNPWDLPLL